METLTFDYFQKYFALPSDKEEEEPIDVKGHIITLTREYGCNAMGIAEGLVKRLNESHIYLGHYKNWKVVNSEVIRQVSKELKMNKELMTEVSTQSKHSFFDKLLGSFDKYSSDADLKKALRGVIASYMQRGNVVFVGRGAGFYAPNHKSIHNIKLEANISYRAKRLMLKEGMSQSEAYDKIDEMDAKRTRFLRFLSGGRESSYSLIINRERLSTSGIVNMLYEAMLQAEVNLAEEE